MDNGQYNEIQIGLLSKLKETGFLHLQSMGRILKFTAVCVLTFSSHLSAADPGEEPAFLRRRPQLRPAHVGLRLQEGQRLPHHVREDQRSPDQ